MQTAPATLGVSENVRKQESEALRSGERQLAHEEETTRCQSTYCILMTVTECSQEVFSVWNFPAPR